MKMFQVLQAIQICCCSPKAGTDNVQVYKCGYVPIKLYFLCVKTRAAMLDDVPKWTQNATVLPNQELPVEQKVKQIIAIISDVFI